MNEKKCEQIMDKFLMLDKHEHIPIDVTVHLLTCQKCRTQVRYLTLAEKYTAEPLKISGPITDSRINAILSAINPKWTTDNFKLKPVSMVRWIVCGILMILFMLSFTIFAEKVSSEFFSTVFYIIFGLFVTAYCSLFIGANLDFFIKKIERA
ncbi:MAG: hypothetical protein KBT11_10895 [Treponema sp.]|nr:hypothetical protein [Candidatus Treponema equifaecale]